MSFDGVEESRPGFGDCFWFDYLSFEDGADDEDGGFEVGSDGKERYGEGREGRSRGDEGRREEFELAKDGFEEVEGRSFSSMVGEKKEHPNEDIAMLSPFRRWTLIRGSVSRVEFGRDDEGFRRRGRFNEASLKKTGCCPSARNVLL